jgi:hypothetical protein
LDLEGPNVRVVEEAEDLSDLEETALVLPEIDGVAALEIDLDEDQSLVVLAENRLQEPASPEDLLQDQVVRRRQVVEVVLGSRDLSRARDLVAHSVLLCRSLFFIPLWLRSEQPLSLQSGRGCLSVAPVDSQTYLSWGLLTSVTWLVGMGFLS